MNQRRCKQNVNICLHLEIKILAWNLHAKIFLNTQGIYAPDSEASPLPDQRCALMAGLPPPAHRPALCQEPADTDVAYLSEARVIKIIGSDCSVVLALLARVSLTPTRSQTVTERAADGPAERST